MKEEWVSIKEVPGRLRGQYGDLGTAVRKVLANRKDKSLQLSYPNGMIASGACAALRTLVRRDCKGKIKICKRGPLIFLTRVD